MHSFKIVLTKLCSDHGFSILHIAAKEIGSKDREEGNV